MLTVRGGIFQGIVRSSNQAVFAFVFGDYLSLTRHGRRYTLRHTGNLFAIGGPGAPIMRQTNAADTNLILAAVSGRRVSTGQTYKIKGNAWPFYYGIQPTGRYPDEPFVKELYYDGPFTGRLTRVPEPKAVVPQTHNIVKPHHVPPPRQPGTNPIITQTPGITCANC